ncbi:M48 family metallopeptidase [Neptuniibacter sp.]|uniref:M48 family metallopeptidase n=1 Tax=Neptuniibacter sp. TaxID=1962643 RepID=UPI002624091E|nr:M48 family metallopeptidase [Neptuniibacter sp.]MCP4598279.1 M48 family metalloprotease [Neptuniibacter sp.]
MDKLIFLLVLSAILSGCVTPSIKPVKTKKGEQAVSNRQVLEAAREINSYNVRKPPKRYFDENKQLYKKTVKRILPAAITICKEIKGSSETCSWDIGLANSRAFNAYATGDKEIKIFLGVVENIYYEDELAFVIAHEIGHHLASHITESMITTAIGAVLGASVGSPDLGAGIGRAAFSKSQEIEADYISMLVLKEAGYDIDRARECLIRMTRIGGGGVYSVFLGTHPSGPERLLRFDSNFAEMEKD